MPLTLFPGIPHVLWHTSFLLNQHCQGIFLKQTLGTAEPCIKCSVLPPYPCSLLSVRKSWSQTHHTATAILLRCGTCDFGPRKVWPEPSNFVDECLLNPCKCPVTFGLHEFSWSLPWDFAVSGQRLLASPLGRNSLYGVDIGEILQAKRLFIDKCRPGQVERCGNGVQWIILCESKGFFRP